MSVKHRTMWRSIVVYLLYSAGSPNQGLFEAQIIVYGDSKLVIEQMFGSWKIRKGAYVPLALAAQRLLRQFKNIKGRWIPREKNEIADELSKSALVREGVPFRIQPH